jgi:hypothetical protein
MTQRGLHPPAPSVHRPLPALRRPRGQGTLVPALSDARTTPCPRLPARPREWMRHCHRRPRRRPPPPPVIPVGTCHDEALPARSASSSPAPHLSFFFRASPQAWFTTLTTSSSGNNAREERKQPKCPCSSRPPKFVTKPGGIIKGEERQETFTRSMKLITGRISRCPRLGR